MKKEKIDNFKFSRIKLIDFVRGLALIGMGLFHFFWNLNYFQVINISLYEGFFGIFQKTILFTFIFISGISLVLLSRKNDFKRSYQKHLIILTISAVLVTIISFIIFDSAPILFGVLHLILFSWIFGVFFLNKTKLALVFGLVILIFPILFPQNIFSSNLIFFIGPNSIFPSLDFVPLIPWFGVFLLGLFFGGIVKNNQSQFSKIVIFNKLNLISFIGKKALFFYLTHQLVLFPLAFLVSLFF
jgi:uncharacterized membrane protein